MNIPISMVASYRNGIKYNWLLAFMALNTIYMKEELGKSLTVSGIVLMINSFWNGSW